MAALSLSRVRGPVTILLLLLSASTASTEGGDVLANLASRITREGGYVHPSLQLVSPAPCGADRGVIFANDATDVGDDGDSAIWLRVPLSYQLTRNLALETLTPLIPDHVLEDAPLVTLDDAALLVLLIVHLRGLMAQDDKWYPYLATLPDDPGCGWWEGASPNSPNAEGYGDIIASSRQYVSRVSQGMAQDYGQYLSKEHWPESWKENVNGESESAALAIKWSLCIVSSRGTAASPGYGGGSVRLVPLADMFNHNLHSDGFIELTDKDVGSKGELIGSFEVRRKEGTLPGEEITVDYNLVGFSPEDWHMSHGFVPSEVLGTIGRSEL